MHDTHGLLIINADDWGESNPVTDKIVDCYRSGGITSTTALTHMAGSRFAAAQAAELPRLGIGLHLNLVDTYTDPNTPQPVRDRQQRVIDHLGRGFRRWHYDRRIASAIDAVITDQLACFADLYGRAPTHIDGHHHRHLCANVLLSDAIPDGTKMRTALNLTNPPEPYARAQRERTSSTLFFSLPLVWEDRRGPRLDKLRLARRTSVEVMAHPASPPEYVALQSEAWQAALRDLPTGSFHDLKPDRSSDAVQT